MSLFAFLQSVDISSVIVAFITAAISIVGALYLTSRKINAELHLRRIELTRAYSETILKSRLEVYKELWHILSHNLKIIHGTHYQQDLNGATDASKLNSLFEKLSDWDSKNTLLLSKRSGYLIHQLRMQLLHMINLPAAESVIIDNREREKVIESLRKLEISIKTDLGIFEVDEFEARKTISGYSELNRSLRAPSRLPA